MDLPKEDKCAEETEMDIKEIFAEDATSCNKSLSKGKVRSSSVTESTDSLAEDSSLYFKGGTIVRSKSLTITYSPEEEHKDTTSLNPTICDSKLIQKICDAVDAHVQIVADDDESDIEIRERPSTPVAVLSVIKDAECYNMNHKNRGKCVIFNHEIFDTGFEKREGSATDSKRLQHSFRKLGFDITVHNDLSHVEVMNEIEKLSNYDHSDNDCLCIFVLTHGLQNDLICAKDAAYRSDKIWKPFTADRCTTLAGKPKLFFFQACRGDDFDSGVTLSPRSLIATETDSVTSYKIPSHADFLLAHSSVQGFYTWRNPVQGTWYVECLCEVLDSYGTQMDLMSMLTITARKVATDYASKDPVNTTRNKKKQVPSVTTMLLRYVYFPLKSNV